MEVDIDDDAGAEELTEVERMLVGVTPSVIVGIVTVGVEEIACEADRNASVVAENTGCVEDTGCVENAGGVEDTGCGQDTGGVKDPGCGGATGLVNVTVLCESLQMIPPKSLVQCTIVELAPSDLGNGVSRRRLLYM